MSRKELHNQEHMPKEDKKFVFICGLHKSGTSLLFRILRDHPDMSGFTNTGVPKDEGQHLQSVYPPAWRFGGVLSSQCSAISAVCRVRAGCSPFSQAIFLPILGQKRSLRLSPVHRPDVTALKFMTPLPINPLADLWQHL